MMTEREKDERDLAILRDYEAGTPKAELMRNYGVARSYIYKLIEEALDA